MYCPRCGASQPLGTRRCARCGQPFTRRGYARRQGADPAAAAGVAPRYREWERGPGAGRRALGCLAVLVVTVVLILAGSAVFTDVVRPYVGSAITERLNPLRPAEPDEAAQAPAATVPTPSPGAQQVIITQDELNQRIEENRERIQPLDSVRVEITPDAFALELRAFGLSGRYEGQVTAEGGQVQLSGGRVTGALGWLIPVEPLESALNEQLRQGLDQTGVAVEAVTLEDGQMTLTLAPSSD